MIGRKRQQIAKKKEAAEKQASQTHSQGDGDKKCSPQRKKPK